MFSKRSNGNASCRQTGRLCSGQANVAPDGFRGVFWGMSRPGLATCGTVKPARTGIARLSRMNDDEGFEKAVYFLIK